MKLLRIIAATASVITVLLSALLGANAVSARTMPPASSPAAGQASGLTASSFASRPQSVSRDNAAQMARDYLAYSAFSRIGLIKQLKFEGFSTADATYGADSTGANWYRQAARMAKEYLDYQPFSRSGLISQLKYEGFTTGQATYGARRAGL